MHQPQDVAGWRIRRRHPINQKNANHNICHFTIRQILYIVFVNFEEARLKPAGSPRAGFFMVLFPRRQLVIDGCHREGDSGAYWAGAVSVFLDRRKAEREGVCGFLIGFKAAGVHPFAELVGGYCCLLHGARKTIFEPSGWERRFRLSPVRYPILMRIVSPFILITIRTFTGKIISLSPPFSVLSLGAVAAAPFDKESMV